MNHSLKKILNFSLFVVFMALTATVSTAADMALKVVTLDEFMQGNVTGKINVPVVVPEAFKPAVLAKADLGYSYWMMPDDVATSDASGDLPGENGYMYGTLSPNVAYDAKNNIFTGLEERNYRMLAHILMPQMKIERYRFGSYPIVLVSTSIENKLIYAMYVATKIDSNVVYIALRPPFNSEKNGKQIWDHLKTLLQRSEAGT